VKDVGSAVGLRPALNAIRDQQTIIDLLGSIDPVFGGGNGGIPSPRTANTCSSELVGAILRFQQKYPGELTQDSRIDPGGKTIRKMNDLSGKEVLIDGKPEPGPRRLVHREPDREPRPQRLSKLGHLQDLTKKTLMVEDYIGRAMHAARDRQDEYDALVYAAEVLKNERNLVDADGHPKNCGNKNLAYAEHYVLARAQVAYGGDKQANRNLMYKIAMGLVETYEAGKSVKNVINELNRVFPGGLFDGLHDLFKLFHELGVCPASNGPSDPLSRVWGRRGVTDGLLVYPGKTPTERWVWLPSLT
jgi:hypothetical protein